MIFVLLFLFSHSKVLAQNCQTLLTQSTCLNQNYMNCIWNWQTKLCENNYETDKICEEMISKQGCLQINNYCAWNPYNQRCYAVTSFLNLECDQNYGKKLCESLYHCQFVNSCIQKTCSFYSRNDCLHQNHIQCYWKYTQQLCLSISLQSQERICENMSPQACRNYQGCVYEKDHCLPNWVLKNSCEYATNLKLCLESTVPCIWQNDQCIKPTREQFSSSSCIANFNVNACNLQNAYCQFDYDQNICVESKKESNCHLNNRVACLTKPKCQWVGDLCILDNCNVHGQNELECKEDPVNLCMWNSISNQCLRSTSKSCLIQSDTNSLHQSKGACLKSHDACIWNTIDKICIEQATAGFDFCQASDGYLNKKACTLASVPCKFLNGFCDDFDKSSDSFLIAFNEQACISDQYLRYKWVHGKCIDQQDSCEQLSLEQCRQTRLYCMIKGNLCKSIPQKIEEYQFNPDQTISFGTCMRTRQYLEWDGSQCMELKDSSQSCSSNLNLHSCMNVKNTCQWLNYKCTDFLIGCIGQNQDYCNLISGCVWVNNKCIGNNICQNGRLNKYSCINSGQCIWNPILNKCSTISLTSKCYMAYDQEYTCNQIPYCLFDNYTQQCQDFWNQTTNHSTQDVVVNQNRIILCVNFLLILYIILF